MKLGNTITHPLAQMLPLGRYQASSYRFGRGLPPGLEGKAPRWIVVNFTLTSQQTQRESINVPPNFWLIGALGSSTAAAGFRVQLYDADNKVKLQARGVNRPLGLGTGAFPFFLREPYCFGPEGECLVIVQNQALVAATVQVLLYGVCEDGITAPDPIDPGLPEYGASKGEGNRRPGGL
jgi:hypothetical protein